MGKAKEVDNIRLREKKMTVFEVGLKNLWQLNKKEEVCWIPYFTFLARVDMQIYLQSHIYFPVWN